MTEQTQNWLKQTDAILAQGNDTSKEVLAIMGIVRGPDYVRLKGGNVSPLQADRSAAKLETTAVLRAAAFPLTFAAAQEAIGNASRHEDVVKVLAEQFGYSDEEATTAANIRFRKTTPSDWMMRQASSISVRFLDNVLGSKSHFAIKVKKAARVLGVHVN